MFFSVLAVCGHVCVSPVLIESCGGVVFPCQSVFFACLVIGRQVLCREIKYFLVVSVVWTGLRFG